VVRRVSVNLLIPRLPKLFLKAGRR